MDNYILNLVVAIMDSFVGLSGIFFVMNSRVNMWLNSYVGDRLVVNIYQIALIVGCLGLFGQAYRNICFLVDGVSFSDNDMPLWVLKDIGYWIAGIASGMWLIRNDVDFREKQ
jgi:hypothetical protein